MKIKISDVFDCLRGNKVCVQVDRRVFYYCNEGCALGQAEKWGNDILKCVDVDYYGTGCPKKNATLGFCVVFA